MFHFGRRDSAGIEQQNNDFPNRIRVEPQGKPLSMNTKLRFVPAIACVAMLGLLVAPASAQFSKLVKRVPSSANTIILFNAEKVLNSEIALREGWRTNFEKAIAAGLTHLPPDTLQYVLAAQTDFDYMQPVWQVGGLTTKTKHDMVYLAKKQNGTQDNVAGLPAVLLPSESYLIQFDPYTYATLVPAARQAVTRWIKDTESDEPNLSPYLQEAISFSEKGGTEIIMALDLTDVVDSATVAQRVSESDIATKAGLDAKAVTDLLVSLRGAMLGVTFGEKPFGSIKVDFDMDTAALKDTAPALLMEVLSKRGAMIDDFAAWKFKRDGKTITLSGNLSPAGMRKIFSLIDTPTAKSMPTDTADAQTTSASDQDTAVVASQKYFASVNEYFTDLRNKEPQRIAQYGIWFDKYARKIDQLPMVNVDSDMLDYGAYVAQQFRNAGAAIQGIGIRSRVREVEATNSTGAPGYYGNNYYNGGYAYGGNFYYGAGAYGRGSIKAGMRQQQQARTQVNVEEKAMGVSAARAIMKELENATAVVRRQMTEKYNAEF